MAALSPFTPGLPNLPTEVLEDVAFYHSCPRLLGPPVPLTPLLLTSKSIYHKLSNARHLYARVFKYKFSFSAIRRRGFEPKAGEWMWQLKWWCEVLAGVRKKRRRPDGEEYLDSGPYSEEPGVQETMYALWLMCLEDDGCNRLQMQLSGVYEWVEKYICKEMYRDVNKGWPIASISNNCAMFVFWYLSSKERLLEEPQNQRELIIDNILPFMTVPFRYPSAFAPANHFRLPLRSPSPSSSSTPFSIPTPHGPFPIYLTSHHAQSLPHFDRWVRLSIPLAADAAKVVYFSLRETMCFPVPSILPKDREDHRVRVRAQLAEEHGQTPGEVSELEVESAFRSQLPRPTQEDFRELNEGLLGGVMVVPRPLASATDSSNLHSQPSSHRKGGGTALPRAYDHWDSVRKALPSLLNPTSVSLAEAELDAAERILFESGEGVDESACQSRRWDADWWRLRLCRSCWVETGHGEDDQESTIADIATAPGENSIGNRNEESKSEEEAGMEVEEGAGDAELYDWNSDNERSPTFLTGSPQKGALCTPGALTGLWTGRMLIPSEPRLRALLLPPEPPARVPQLNALTPIDPPGAEDPVNPMDNNAHATPPPPPNDDGNLPEALAALNDGTAAVAEAGHRPDPFNEDTIELFAVPLYVRLGEYAVYHGGKVVPCVADTEKDEDDEVGLDSDAERVGHNVTDGDDDTFDQGISNAWYPHGATLHTRGEKLVVSVPAQSLPPGRGRMTDGMEEFEYVAIDSKSLARDASDDDGGGNGASGTGMGGASRPPKRAQGTFHDRETCPGCRAREEALRAVRARNEAEVALDASTLVGDVPNADPASNDSSVTVQGSSSSSDSIPDESNLPSYVLSPSTIPPCNGIRDILLRGTTDPRHANAWGNWSWKGRVRKWDGLIGLVREQAVEGVCVNSLVCLQLKLGFPESCSFPFFASMLISWCYHYCCSLLFSITG
ncbi:hypothetical protein GYMLUDRAFT_678232 [Collybiopsis luxurians FD-317 M1]|uniref:F-box domain-containing protein n=1 Tax=Collybiopsis luxurians FD-317 M1 TaxID=944289 RepID=A0A0D0CU63_9AGAR|nr:hypothetical protein GYMLUDRAFT_678232 [Collybiopsis luxurians FD-317 M1]